MAYSLNGNDFSTWGIIPGQAPGSHLAIEGILSMPERINKTDHAWGDYDGVEPYVSDGELYWGGRNLVFHGLVQAASRDAAHNALLNFYDFLEGLTDLAVLACDWGSWSVYVNGQIDAEYMGNGLVKVRVPFREPVVDMSGGVVPSSPDFENVSGIDGVDFEELGFTLVDFKSIGIRGSQIEGQLNRPTPKAQDFEAYDSEGFQVTKTEARQYKLKGLIQAASFAGLEATVRNLYAVFSQPGTRVLYVPDDMIRVVFVKNGFQISQVLASSSWSAVMEILLTEATEYVASENWQFLGDTVGNYVVTTDGQKILIRI
jgi:hypothetical protein